MTFALGIRYLTGYSVATDVASREAAEWPPHPARVFMALAAAWFETGAENAQGEALRWLEALPPPSLALGSYRAATRSIPTVYVPVNDDMKASAAPLQSAPTLTRLRQERTFPATHVGDGPVHLIWPGVDASEPHGASLSELSRFVTRIGHSSSLVSLWVEPDPPEPDLAPIARELSLAGQIALRTPESGLLDRLDVEYGGAEIEAFVDLADRIASGSGKEKKAARAEFEARFGQKWSVRLRPPTPRRPRVSTWTRYARATGSAGRADGSSGQQFSGLLIFELRSPSRRRRLDLAATLQITSAARDTFLSVANAPRIRWFSGHEEDEAPDRSSEGHLGFVPIPFVGHGQADGRILGIGLAVPSTVLQSELGRVLGPILYDPETGEPRTLRLRSGRLGEWDLVQADPDTHKRSLCLETWGCGGLASDTRASATWASVTPVVLDRYPKTDRTEDARGWRLEVEGIIRFSCRNVGLPEPAVVDVDTTSWLPGAPRSSSKLRRARQGDARAPIGDGFPPFHPKRGGIRPQLHVWIRFPIPVHGPVLLGAGRYRGYGLLAPLPFMGTRS